MTTWASIRRSIGKGTGLVVVTLGGSTAAPTEGFFHVRRTVSQGMYLSMHHGLDKDTQHFVAWPKATMVDVHGPGKWIVDAVSSKQAWEILPDVPF